MLAKLAFPFSVLALILGSACSGSSGSPSPPAQNTAAPVIDAIGPRSVELGSTLEIALRAEDRDHDALTFDARPSPLPRNASMDSATGVFTFTPDCDQLGAFDLTFVVSDGLREDSEVVTITVSDTPQTSSYRDKHGNSGEMHWGAPVVGTALSHDIDYTVSYVAMDSEGTKSGTYAITSEMLPGRDPASDDFVLSVLVRDDATQRAAELSFRNNPNVAPAMPVVRLLDCSTVPCTEVATYQDPRWGAWVVQDQTHIADYPIELLDARVILELLDPVQLAELPNSADGTGNWAEILENHRTNFEEAKFRADTESLGEPQSDLLTTRMIAELEDKLGMSPGVDWLQRHDPGITHGALTFFTGHKDLIEDMTTVLFETHLDDWPLNYTFPFGRMPVFLVDPHDDAGPDSPSGSDPFHQIPLHWERVIVNPADGFGALGQEGCWHDWEADAYAPLLDDGDGVAEPGEGTTNLGQFECAPVITANGFIDRPCTDPADYGAGIHAAVEGNWHNPIHGVIGGTFGPSGTTAGTMIFWAFHTYASTVALGNWRHAQRRDPGSPNRAPTCSANGPYEAECEGPLTAIQLDSTGSSDPDGDPVTVAWTTDCPGASFSDPASPMPVLTIDSALSCVTVCTVTLTVTDDAGAEAQCSVDVTVSDTTPPELVVDGDPMRLWPPDKSHETIHVTDLVSSVSDLCDAGVSTDSLRILQVSSDEPENGRGDGNTLDDIVIAADCRSVDLRKERAGGGNGRVYSITVSAMDSCGNETSAVCPVFVPHDASSSDATDDGPSYSVGCSG